MKQRLVAFALILVCLAAAPWCAIIKSGDVLDIRVQEHPEYSGTFAVGENGQIDHPLLADESVVNVSTAELMRDLMLQLAKFIVNPMVSVAVVENPEITVMMLGQITKPGPTKAYDNVTLQEALAAAGGPVKSADLSRVKIVRKDKTDQQAEYYNFDTFLKSGDLDAMPRLHERDNVILIDKKQSTKVKVIGAVQKPGFFEPEEQINLFELIYLAGGPAEKADLSRVRRFFKNDGKTMEEVVDLQNYIDKGAMDNIPIVNSGDVIIVYAKWFDWRTVLTILNNTLLFIVTVQAFSGVFKH
jgi:protein involved in polysaccharide export with SLBB domain